MPRKNKSGKGYNAKKGQSKKQKSGKSNHSNKSSNNKASGKQKSNPSQNVKHPPKRPGQAFSKDILSVLNQMTNVLRECGPLKGPALSAASIKLDEQMHELIKLQSGKTPGIWGFEDTINVDTRVLLDRLTLWVQKEQKQSSHIKDKFEFKCDLPEGRGVVATQDLKQGQHAMSIERRLMMSYSYVLTKSDEKFRRFIRTDDMCKFGTLREHMDSLAMVLFVWYERMKGKGSFWKPYLDALPTKFGLPHESKTEDLVPFLEGSLILEKICRLKISHLRHYTYCRQMLSRAGIEPGLRLADYMWAAGVVMTRQNRIPIENRPEHSELALIPAWDMCNYKGGTVTTYFNTKQQRNEMFTMEAVSKGNQIYIFYGGQRNELLYLNSGFVIEDNPNDELELDLRLDPDDPLCALKTIQIKNAKLTNPIKCLVPVLGHDRYDGTEITLNATIEEVESKLSLESTPKGSATEKTENVENAQNAENPQNDENAENPEIAQNEENPQNEENVETLNESTSKEPTESKQFEDDDVSTKWMLHMFESKGLKIPPPGIRFARLMTMNKEEIQGFMQRFYAKKKKDDVTTLGVVDLENVEEDKVQSTEDIGEPRELVSVENEIRAWNVLLGKADKMYSFFGDKLKLCIDAHLKGMEGQLMETKEDEIDVIYGDDDPLEDTINDKSMDFDAEKVMAALESKGKDCVALTFKLLQIERKHYKEVVDIMREGIHVIEERLKRVLKKEDKSATENNVMNGS